MKHLRYHAQRWSDLLLAPLITQRGAEAFAVDARRSNDLHGSYFRAPSHHDAFWRLFATSVRVFFRRYALHTAPSAEENRGIVQSIYDGLPAGLLDDSTRKLSAAGPSRNGRTKTD